LPTCGQIAYFTQREEVRTLDELVKLVSQKTGLSEEMARTAVEMVVGYLKEKLPAPIAGQIDSVLGGGEMGKKAGEIAKGLGGILGKK
jgi:hypothetical protein